jgi:UDP-glucose 4-epimerase
MRYLVTGSAGHLGEGLMRTLRVRGLEAVGLDILDSPYTDVVGSVADPDLVKRSLKGCDIVLHTATLHKPHVATHSKAQFVESNITGTLHLLEAALEQGLLGVVFTSTTSAFGAALKGWINEEVRPIPKNIYGVTKVAAEDLCQLFYRTRGLPSVVLRTSRFFPEPDDDPRRRNGFGDHNLKVNEFLYRRVELSDVVSAHLLAAERLPLIGFDRYIVSATTPFQPEHTERLQQDTPGLVAELFPHYPELYDGLGWRMNPTLDRVYDNRKAREQLGWQPEYNFGSQLERLARGESTVSALTQAVGAKGYHPGRDFGEIPFPVEA